MACRNGDGPLYDVCFGNLWNWFVVPAFHTFDISFWQMFGLTLFVGLLTHFGEEADASANECRWKGLLTMVDACVPREPRGVSETIQQQRKVLGTSRSDDSV